MYGEFSFNLTEFSALEALIRAKYEQKKYIDKSWVPPQISVSILFLAMEDCDR